MQSAAIRWVVASALRYLKQPVSVAMPVYRAEAISTVSATPNRRMMRITTMAAAAQSPSTQVAAA